MNIKKEGEEYWVESSSSKGKWYTVDPKKPWCDCPAYKFKHIKSKSACKHIKAVREYIERTQQETLVDEQQSTDAVIAYVEKNGGSVDSIKLVNKFGEDKVDSLIKQGEIIENKGKIQILK